VVANRKFSVSVAKEEPFGTPYPMEYDDLPEEVKKVHDRLEA
jgi:hypothetical protein